MANGPSNELGSSSGLLQSLAADIALHKRFLDRKRQEENMERLRQKLSSLSDAKNSRSKGDADKEEEGDMEEGKEKEERSKQQEKSEKAMAPSTPSKSHHRTTNKGKRKSLTSTKGKTRSKGKDAARPSVSSKSSSERSLSPISMEERKRMSKRAKTQAQRIGLDP